MRETIKLAQQDGLLGDIEKGGKRALGIKLPETDRLIEQARSILDKHNPQTLRQVYYQLVSNHGYENSVKSYKRLVKTLSVARKDGDLPMALLEDRPRFPKEPSSWQNIGGFLRAMRYSYHRNIWPDQPRYLEVWVEKDALSGIFWNIVAHYGVTLQIGRGYASVDCMWNAAMRFKGWTELNGEAGTILYWGDFDPSGENIPEVMGRELARYGAHPNIIVCALREEDIGKYNLAPNKTKHTDTRTRGFIERHGDVAVELDALPIEILEERIGVELQMYLDTDALERTKQKEEDEQERFEAFMDSGEIEEEVE